MIDNYNNNKNTDISSNLKILSVFNTSQQTLSK